MSTTTTPIKLDPPARERLAPHRGRLLKAADQTDRQNPHFRAITARGEFRCILTTLVNADAAAVLRQLNLELGEIGAESIYATDHVEPGVLPGPGRWVLPTSLLT